MSGRLQKGVGVRAALLVVVLVPLIGLGASAAASVRRANDVASAADEVLRTGNEVSSLTSLQAALYTEHFWAGTVEALTRLGRTPAEAAPFLGHDADVEVADARAEVDRLSAELQLPDFTQLVAEARLVGATPNGEPGVYGDAERLLDDVMRDQVDHLSEAAGGVQDTTKLSHASSVLVTAVDLRRQAFLVTANLFGLRFREQAISADPGAALIGARAGFSDEWKRLDLLVGDSEPMATQLEQVSNDPRTKAFLASVDSAIRAERTEPGSGEDDGVGPTVVSEFTDALVVLDGYVGLVRAASDDVVQRAQLVADDADDSRQTALLAVGAVTIVTILTVGAFGRWMVVSIDGIAASATAMNAGHLDLPAPVKGPREVRLAAQALNSAASHLRSAERQALALARHDVGDPEVPDPDPEPGRLGSSVQEAMASLATSWQEREELRRRLQHEAMHDGLTGLPNRTSIVSALASALAERGDRQAGVGVLFIDLDGFKQVNDQHGHAAGDEVLCAIADRIMESVRGSDVVGRLGGDEFVVVADPVSSADEARALAARISASIRRPISITTSSVAPAVTPALSIGVAISGPETTGAAELLHDADLAVYEAKAVGAGAIEVCTPELRRAADERQAVEAALRQAIEHDELRVHFQPVVDADDLRPVSVEALVRWPDRAGIDPTAAEFVTVAERSDLVVLLDRWVVERTIEQLADAGSRLGRTGVTAAVNVSARHASARPFAAPVLALLERHGVAPDRLMVELTESALLADVDHVVAELQELRDHGVSVAIDDFGTGYTSLALLHRLPVDTLKLDRELTSALAVPEVEAIVKLIVDTAHVLGLTVIAEGVETREQSDALVDLGVDQLQGYWFGYPVPVQDLPDLRPTTSVSAADHT